MAEALACVFEMVMGCWEGPDPAVLPAVPLGCYMVLGSCNKYILDLHGSFDVGNQVQIHQALTEKYQLLRCFLEEKVQGVLVGSSSSNCMTSMLSCVYFFSLFGERLWTISRFPVSECLMDI